MKKGFVVSVLLLAALLITFASGNRALAALPETTPVWRAQFVLAIADVSEAGTDDDVKIQLNPSNSTWLDSARDDYERNSTFTYDLMLTNVRQLGNISMLRISKLGTNAFCVRSMALLINGRRIYDKLFGNTQTTCLWLDNGDGHPNSYTVSSATLRAHPSWIGFVQPAVPTTLTRNELERRIEGAVGDRIRGNDLMWGNYGHGRDECGV